MNLIGVESSNIAAVGWEQNVLRVQFKNGGIYDYDGVDQGTFQQLLDAPSKGTFLSKEIKGKFPYNKVG